MIILDKMIGETPLEALERFRAREVAAGKTELVNVPMTYAGRLDPMAEGKLIILIGDECKEKEKYLKLDKEYEVEIVFGIETDTYDALGLVTNEDYKDCKDCKEKVSGEAGFFAWNTREEDVSLQHVYQSDGKSVTSAYVGKFIQEYPPYSSKTVNGKQLHMLARNQELPDEIPTKEVEIYSIEELGWTKIGVTELKNIILEKISKVKGDFRQSEINKRWNKVLGDSKRQFDVLKIRVKCSSGTYMRSLAHRIGKDRGIGAFALSIKRTKILLTNDKN